MSEKLLNSIHLCEVVRVQDYGAFARIPDEKQQGLIHRSQVSSTRVDDVSEILQQGERVWCKIISINDGKIALSMKVVDQGSGRDLDPNGVQAHLDEQRRKKGPDYNKKSAIKLEAVFNVTCAKCGTRGHLAKDCFKGADGKTYELLFDEEEEDSRIPPAAEALEKVKREERVKTDKKDKKKKRKREKEERLSEKKNKKAEEKVLKRKKRKRSDSTSSSSSSSRSSPHKDHRVSKPTSRDEMDRGTVPKTLALKRVKTKKREKRKRDKEIKHSTARKKDEKTLKKRKKRKRSESTSSSSSSSSSSSDSSSSSSTSSDGSSSDYDKKRKKKRKKEQVKSKKSKR